MRTQITLFNKSIQDNLIATYEKLNLHSYEQESKAHHIQHTVNGFSQLLNAKARQYLTVLVTMRFESWLTQTLKLQIPEANSAMIRILRRTLMRQKLQENDLKTELPVDIMNQHIAFLQS